MPELIKIGDIWELGADDGSVIYMTEYELECLRDYITAALQDADLTTKEKENVYDR